MSADAHGAIHVDHAGFVYPDGSRVLTDICLDVTPGHILALVGRSGSGKSTLIKLINGMRHPTEGQVLVDGRPTTSWDLIRLRRGIGYVLQGVGLMPHMTVADNAGLVLRLEGWAPARIAPRVHELLTLVGLDPGTYAGRLPQTLSGGQQQRVGVARALAASPAILLMDEPFGALDPVTRREIRQEFQSIQARLGTTVVLVTHDLQEAFALGTRVGVMDAGSLIALGTPDEIRTSRDPRVQVFL